MTSAIRPWFTALVALVAIRAAGAAEPAPAQCGFPAEFILQAGDAIGLTDSQKQQITAAHQQAQMIVQQAQAALATSIAGILSAEQQRKLATLQPQLEAFARAQQEAQLRMMQMALAVQAKMARVQALIQVAQQNGNDLPAIHTEMIRLQAAATAGQPDQVVAILDRLLAALEPR